MEITLSTTLQREIEGAVREFEYPDERRFVEDALARRLLALKKASFLSSVAEVREALERAQVSEQEMLADFEHARRSGS